jgi:hypothetical protein
MLALSIRQPYAELILRGIKQDGGGAVAGDADCEGAVFYIYASKGHS